MSTTPRAKYEYSRGSGLSGRGPAGDFDRSGPPWGRHTDELDHGSGGVILAGALLAALLLIVAEFTSLYNVHIATSSAPLKAVSGGSNHSYAMLAIGLAAATLAFLVWRSGSRAALLGLGLLGVVALLIALLGDLPNSQATGLAGSAARGYVNASSTPRAGLYMETLGGVLLIAASGLGFMLLGSPSPGTPGEGPNGGGNGSAGPDGEPSGGGGRHARIRGASAAAARPHTPTFDLRLGGTGRTRRSAS